MSFKDKFYNQITPLKASHSELPRPLNFHSQTLKHKILLYPVQVLTKPYSFPWKSLILRLNDPRNALASHWITPCIKQNSSHIYWISASLKQQCIDQYKNKLTSSDMERFSKLLIRLDRLINSPTLLLPCCLLGRDTFRVLQMLFQNIAEHRETCQVGEQIPIIAIQCSFRDGNLAPHRQLSFGIEEFQKASEFVYMR